MFKEEPPAKKIQLPPQANIAFFDETDQTIKQADDSALPREQTYQPKWKKVDPAAGHFKKKSKSVHVTKAGSIRKGLDINQSSLKPKNQSTARSRKNSQAVGKSKNANFLITSPTAMNMTMTEIMSFRETDPNRTF